MFNNMEQAMWDKLSETNRCSRQWIIIRFSGVIVQCIAQAGSVGFLHKLGGTPSIQMEVLILIIEFPGEKES